MFQLGIDSIRERSTNGPTYMKGRAYYRDGHVQSISFDQKKGLVQAQVNGTRIYQVRVIITRSGELHDAICTCNAFSSYWGFCKHIVAVLLYCVDQYGSAKTHITPAEKPIENTAEQVRHSSSAASQNLRRSRLKARDFIARLQRAAELADKNNKQPIKLRVTLYCPLTANSMPYLGFALGTEHLFPVTNAEQFAEAVTRDQALELDQRFTFDPLVHTFAEPDQALIKLIQEAYEADYKSVFGTSRNAAQNKYLVLNASRLAKFLKLAPDLTDAGWISAREDRSNPFKVSCEPLPISLKLEQEADEPDSEVGAAVGSKVSKGTDERFRLTLVAAKPLSQITATRNVYLFGDTFYLPPRASIQLCEPILSMLGTADAHSITINREELLILLSEIRPQLEKICPILLDPALEKRLLIAPLETQLTLDWRDDAIRVNVVYQYGSQALPLYPPAQPPRALRAATATASITATDNTVQSFSDPTKQDKGNRLAATGKAKAGKSDSSELQPDAQIANTQAEADLLIVRDPAGEASVLQQLKSMGFQKHGTSLRLADADLCYEFLATGLDSLRDTAAIKLTPAMVRLRIVQPPQVRYSIQLDPNKQTLAVKGNWAGMSRVAVGAYIRGLREKRPYIRLADGSFQLLDANDRDFILAVTDALSLYGANPNAAENILPQYRALALAAIAETHSDRIKTNEPYRLLVDRITNTRDMKVRVPSPLGSLLRPYQKAGFQWLVSLDQFGLGGILADDMGLGKTLQTLAYVVHTYRKKKLPTLIVAPTSLVYNWQSEAEKFVPKLPVLVVDGLKQARAELWDTVDKHALVITSYSLMRRDIDLIGEHAFASCFIDEAQNIKNPDTLNARSVKKVRADRYFALTGTPIENSLTELWSLFDFILPGYLFSRNRFQKLYEIPIQREGSQEAVDALHHQIKPFILRRMKHDVLRELPDKIETETVCDMTEKQRAVYDSYLQDARKAFETEVNDKGLAHSQIFILTLLTRLRQICCDPVLCEPDYNGESGKLLLLEELLADSFAAGHRVLVFSAFTSMLEIIRTRQQELGRKPFYIDGQVPAEERLSQVQRFNEGEGELFLISLRSGGTGLNLTGADTVIHYDPWWNPAVEDQATDRAYRIGQENVVQVFKLVTRNSIEEKINNLKSKKKELLDTVVTPGQNFLSQMSLEEIRALFEN
ncbi:MAG: SNF2-related protein [Saccharofermentanales bacterium]